MRPLLYLAEAIYDADRHAASVSKDPFPRSLLARAMHGPGNASWGHNAIGVSKEASMSTVVDASTPALLGQSTRLPDSEKPSTSTGGPSSRQSPVTERSTRQVCVGRSKTRSTAPNDISQMPACLSCRPRRLDCLRNGGSCYRCERLQIKCVLPEFTQGYSRKDIIGLQEQLVQAQQALAGFRARDRSSCSRPLLPRPSGTALY